VIDALVDEEVRVVQEHAVAVGDTAHQLTRDDVGGEKRISVDAVALVGGTRINVAKVRELLVVDRAAVGNGQCEDELHARFPAHHQAVRTPRGHPVGLVPPSAAHRVHGMEQMDVTLCVYVE
jgi:hypothetical protein